MHAQIVALEDYKSTRNDIVGTVVEPKQMWITFGEDLSTRWFELKKGNVDTAEGDMGEFGITSHRNHVLDGRPKHWDESFLRIQLKESGTAFLISRTLTHRHRRIRYTVCCAVSCVVFVRTGCPGQSD